MWNSIIAGGATGFTLAVRQGMAPALVSGGIGKVINRHHPTSRVVRNLFLKSIFGNNLKRMSFVGNDRSWQFDNEQIWNRNVKTNSSQNGK